MTSFLLSPRDDILAVTLQFLPQGVAHFTPSRSFAKPEPQRRPLSLVRSDAGCSAALDESLCLCATAVERMCYTAATPASFVEEK
jgi:hypothetical protein